MNPRNNPMRRAAALLIAALLTTPASGAETLSAVFAGGCFWCVEADFEKLAGVTSAESGYAGGHVENPNYKQVAAGATGHLECVRIEYDPTVVTYTQLLEYLWRHINPTDNAGQFIDRGRQYRPAVFYADPRQRELARRSLQRLAQSGHFQDPIQVDLLPLKAFYPAEEYHQDYYKKNPIRYRFYRWNSGRDQFLEQSWPEIKG